MSSFNGSTETSSLSGAHSATVRLYVVVAGEHIPLAQVGGNRLYFAAPTMLPAGPAEIIAEIDGQTRVWPVTLPACDTPSEVIECTDR